MERKSCAPTEFSVGDLVEVRFTVVLFSRGKGGIFKLEPLMNTIIKLSSKRRIVSHSRFDPFCFSDTVFLKEAALLQQEANRPAPSVGSSLKRPYKSDSEGSDVENIRKKLFTSILRPLKKVHAGESQENMSTDD